MTDLNYNVEGNGKPIILIHGGGTDSRVWSKFKEQLTYQNKIITYDLRGHGKSPIPKKITNHVEDLKVLFSSLKENKAILIGHSLGGQIATEFALVYPQMVSELIVISPGLTGFNYDPAYQGMIKNMWEAVPNVDKMLNITLHTPEAYAMQVVTKSSAKELVETIHRENIVKSLQWENFEQRWPVPNDTNRLKKLNPRVLFIIGSEDKPDLFKIKRLFEQAPKIIFKQIIGADHGLLFTNYKEIASMVEKFVE
jgi:pimeloyl-ACP methyl ester carboxylesterase